MDTYYNEKNLIFTVTNLFAAGTDTTAATLRWGLLFMAKYPHIQGKEGEMRLVNLFHLWVSLTTEQDKDQRNILMLDTSVFLQLLQTMYAL